MKQLLVIICGAAFGVVTAQAQTTTTSSTTSTDSTPSTTTSTTDTTSSSANTTGMSSSSTTSSSGTVTDYTPGAAITLDPGTGKPVQFVIGKTVAIVTPDGKVIKAADVHKNAKVHVHMIADGDQTVVDRIVVDQQ
jgi:hypothetical protein